MQTLRAEVAQMRSSRKVIRDFHGDEIEGSEACRAPHFDTLPVLEKRGAIGFHADVLKYWDGTQWVAVGGGGSGGSVTIGNAGTGNSLVVVGTGSNLTLRGLTAGTGITIAPDGSGNLVISATGGGAATTAASLGAGTSLIGNGAGPNLTFKSLVAGTNIGLVTDANTITISSDAASDVSISTVASGLTPVPPQRAGFVSGGTSVGPNLSMKAIASGSGSGEGGIPGAGLGNIGMTVVDTTTDVLLYSHGYGRAAIIADSTGDFPRNYYAGFKYIYKKNGLTTGEVSNITYVTDLLDATMTLAYPNIPFYRFYYINTFEFEIFQGLTTTLNISMPNTWVTVADLGAVTFDFVRRNVTTHANVTGQPPIPYGAAGAPTVNYVGFDAGSFTATWTISNPSQDLLVKVGL